MSTEPFGRRLLAAAPSERAHLHVEARPVWLARREQIVGSVVARVLNGENVMSVTTPSLGVEPLYNRVEIVGLSDEELMQLDDWLPPPAPPDRRRPATSNYARWAVDLPRAVRADRDFAQTWANADNLNYLQVTNGASMLAVRVIGPIMEDLAQPFRLRRGEGPQTTKGRRDALTRCEIAHQTLGLDTDALHETLDPALERHEVADARARLVQGWSATPSDLGARAITLLAAELAARYYSRARRDGTARKQQVVTSTTQPLLDATLREWTDFVAYLGERQSDVDDAPITVAPIRLSDMPPPEVAARTNLLRDWWKVLDSAQTHQEIDAPAAHEMITSLQVRLGYDEWSPGFRHWTSYLPHEIAHLITEFWGVTVLGSNPKTIITEVNPQATFFELLGPAVQVWDSIGFALWSLYGRGWTDPPVDQLHDHLMEPLDELEDLGTPITADLFNDLVTRKDQFPDPDGSSRSTIGLRISLSNEGQLEFEDLAHDDSAQPSNEDKLAFTVLRDTITRHRRAWIERNLDRYLQTRWQNDLTRAGERYTQLHIGKGKPPTVKQSFNILKDAAIAWFGGDFAALAGALGLEGPVRTTPAERAPRELPAEMVRIEDRVCELLGGSHPNTADRDPARHARYELSRVLPHLLAVWQATGELPSRTKTLPNRGWLLDRAYAGDDPDTAYERYLDVVKHALREADHPAAHL